MTELRLSADQRRALAMLAAAGRDGTTRASLIAQGFGVSLIASLVNQGLATLTYENVRNAIKIIDVGKVRITEAGRAALAES